MTAGSAFQAGTGTAQFALKDVCAPSLICTHLRLATYLPFCRFVCQECPALQLPSCAAPAGAEFHQQ
eukprot:1159949-Pelagomonas_calceolata.AAC.6